MNCFSGGGVHVGRGSLTRRAAPPAVPGTRPDDDDDDDDNAPHAPPARTVFQGFEWYAPADQRHWRRLAAAAAALAHLGLTHLWIPPACKAFWRASVGYDVYDLYDLGEFDQKGAVPTKYGPRDDLLHLAHVARRQGLRLVFDAVLNHKAGADYVETVEAVEVDPEDRRKEKGEPREIHAWTGFDFAGRGDTYSAFKWDKSHFNGVDYDHKTQSNTSIWRFADKAWAPDVDPHLGNYDYLMFANIDYSVPAVRHELLDWVGWLARQLPGLGGLRLDAVKHMSRNFVRDLVLHAREALGPQGCYIVGDYWTADAPFLAGVIEYMDHHMALYDVPLLHNFRDLSRAKRPDLRTVFVGSLTSLKPDQALSFIATHDTQKNQPCETIIEPWFIPLAYALILLRANAGTPCVFYGHLYGTYGPKNDGAAPVFEPPALQWPLTKLLLARRLWAHGAQHDHLDQRHCVGFTRVGVSPTRRSAPASSASASAANNNRAAGLAVLMTSSARGAWKRMYVGPHHAGERWTDLLNGTWGEVTIGRDGWALFSVAARKVAVWVSKQAPGRDMVNGFLLPPIADV